MTETSPTEQPAAQPAQAPEQQDASAASVVESQPTLAQRIKSGVGKLAGSGIAKGAGIAFGGAIAGWALAGALSAYETPAPRTVITVDRTEESCTVTGTRGNVSSSYAVQRVKADADGTYPGSHIATTENFIYKGLLERIEMTDSRPVDGVVDVVRFYSLAWRPESSMEPSWEYRQGVREDLSLPMRATLDMMLADLRAELDAEQACK